jgi:hypothetical protein
MMILNCILAMLATFAMIIPGGITSLPDCFWLDVFCVGLVRDSGQIK